MDASQQIDLSRRGWRIKCRKMVAHVHSTFSFRSESWSWSPAILDKMTEWETEAVNEKLPLLFGVFAESSCGTLERVHDQRPNAVIITLKHVFKWRSTKW